MMISPPVRVGSSLTPPRPDVDGPGFETHVRSPLAAASPLATQTTPSDTWMTGHCTQPETKSGTGQFCRQSFVEKAIDKIKEESGLRALCIQIFCLSA